MGPIKRRGPLALSRPFYPAPKTLELTLLHPPGALVEGDQLSVRLNVKSGAKVVVVTPAAQKIYKAREVQSQTITLEVEAATLEWLPQETIVFAGARGVLSLTAEVAALGRFLGWEMVALKADHKEASGSLSLATDISRAGRLVFRDRRTILFPTAKRWLRSHLGWADQPVAGVLWALGREGQIEAALLATAAEKLQKASEAFDGFLGLTVRGELLLARCLGPSVEKTKAFLEKVWRTVRELWGEATYRPRIWST